MLNNLALKNQFFLTATNSDKKVFNEMKDIILFDIKLRNENITYHSYDGSMLKSKYHFANYYTTKLGYEILRKYIPDKENEIFTDIYIYYNNEQFNHNCEEGKQVYKYYCYYKMIAIVAMAREIIEVYI